jgi:hypothetical protein
MYGQQLIKSNTTYLETLYSNEKIVLIEEFQELLNIRDEIAVLDPIRHINSAFGQSMEKRKALCHPYPTLQDKIDKYGYDPKQLHHIFRLNILMQKYIIGYNPKGYNYKDCLRYGEMNKDILMRLKLHPMDLQEAINTADSHIASSKILKSIAEEKFQKEPNQETIKKIKIICKKITLKYLTTL